MEGFQKSVLIVAVIILVLALVVMAIILSGKSGEEWPPLVSDCPDWWVIDGSGNRATCTNVKDLGVCPANSGDKHQVMNFNSAAFTGDNGTCAKYTWANKCKVSWDGITYGVSNPCST
jgi:hypothetical protein